MRSISSDRRLVRVPLFKDRPSFRQPRAMRRVLVICSPIDADVKSLRRLWRRVRPLGVALLAASECQGEVRGEHREPLFPNLLLIEAVGQTWDAVIVAGGAGARRVAEDALARDLVAQAAQKGTPIAALGAGRGVLERAVVRGFAADSDEALCRWLSEQLDLPSPRRLPALRAQPQ